MKLISLIVSANWNEISLSPYQINREKYEHELLFRDGVRKQEVSLGAGESKDW